MLPSPGTTEEGQEYLVVRTAAGASAVVLVTVENGPLHLQKGAFDIELWRELDVGEREFLNAAYAHSRTAEREATNGRLTRLRTGEMEPYYIMRYGFYEGHTEYRVDPIALAVTFGLKPLTEIEKAFPGELHRVLTNHFTASARTQRGIEAKAQPGGPANGSQPVSSDTNRTSPPAASPSAW